MEEKSELEVALEYIADYPEITETLNDEEFATFFAHPSDVIAEYKRNIEFLKTSFGFTEEMIQENCVAFLNDACHTYKTYTLKRAKNVYFR